MLFSPAPFLVSVASVPSVCECLFRASAEVRVAVVHLNLNPRGTEAQRREGVEFLRLFGCGSAALRLCAINLQPGLFSR